MNEHNLVPKKKKWYKNKKFYIIGAIVLVLVIIIISKVGGGEKGPQYEFVTVERGALSQTVDATGNVESANELDLRFETSGRVAKVYKQAGDKVRAGEIIVDLNLNELNATVARYSASVEKAQANLDKLVAGQTDSYLNSLKAKVDQAQANLDQIKATYDNSIADTEAAVGIAKINLELSEGGEDSQVVGDAYDDMLALLNSTQNTLSSALTEADNILGIDNILANDDYEGVLSSLDSSKLNTANTKYYSAKAAKIDADTAINSISSFSSGEKNDWAVQMTEEALLTSKELMFAVTEVLDNTTSIGNLSQSALDVLKSGVQTDYTAINTQYTNLINQKQAVEAAKNSYSNYQITYDNAVANLENLIKKKNADVAAYEALLGQAEANYNDSKNPPRQEDMATYEASLAEARANLAQVVASRNKARIIAPVEGTIGKIDAKVGEYISSQDAVVKLVNPHFEIKVDIPETDIIKVSLSDEAKINLDAYSDGVDFKGMVTEIEIGETVIQDVVYYSVTLSIEDSEEYNILNGMTADVLFYTEEKENVLYVPARAVRSNDEGKYVRIVKDGELIEVSVKTGLRGDAGLVEILEGLEENQEIVLRVIE
jgi:HlyD family secretion protein